MDGLGESRSPESRNPRGDIMTTYRIMRFYEKTDSRVHNRTIKKGLTLSEAQEHCQRDNTSGFDNGTRWFDGYTEEVVS